MFYIFLVGRGWGWFGEVAARCAQDGRLAGTVGVGKGGLVRC